MNRPASPPHLLIVVGSYAAADQPGIYFFSCDPANGALTPGGAYTGITNPSFLIIHPNRRWLYAAIETGGPDGPDGAVWAFRFEERHPPALRPLNHRPSGGDSPCHLQLDATGKWLLVSNYSSGTAALFPVQPDGSLGEMADLVQHRGRGPHPERQDGPHAHSSIFTPDNRFAIVADLGIDRLMLYAFDSATGKLQSHGQVATRPGAGPRHMAFHPGGRYLYAANELDNTVTAYSFEAATAALEEQQTVTTLPAASPSELENTVAHIQLSPSGRQLYVSNRGHNSIALFSVDAAGRLAHQTTAPCGGRCPRHFTLAPSISSGTDGGPFLLVANQYSGELAVLPLRAGVPTRSGPAARAAVPHASCVQVMAGHE